MLVKRRKTKEIKVGNVKLGGNNPIRVQSMCSTKTKDINATIKQIHSLEETGCELIRIAVPDIESVKKIKKIKQQINIPLIADIHYDYKLALESLKQGVDKIRINPGNIPEDELKLIVKEAKDADKPIRIGINIGSLPKNITQKFGFTSEAMFKAASDTVDTFENLDFRNIVVSLKSSDIFQTIEANRLFSEKSDYPLHLGITEAGTIKSGIAKSSIGLGYLLIKGIGDTIRVSLTADPTEEVLTAYNILKSLNLRKGATVISCPTCGRAEIDVINIAEEIEKRLIKIEKPIKVGVLGCFVNVEEAKMADVGIAGAEKYGIIFKKGKIIRKVEKENLIEEILKEIY
ncbi:MAG: flavodoxin-dependent (E)-4-hydroxy-3-methylbut-2-enyl-diphosphate synthase [Nanoarchaeota archaeon]|nr:flavodoxin-dependent (E)-4-hydroxy-3-methylbut-2-enyl-diphosphate synthase [Nanoarchaeota archaeon]